MAISKELAIRSAVEYLVKEIDANSVVATWPVGSYIVGNEAVWAVPIPDHAGSVGRSRFIVVSQESGKVVADGLFGE